MEDVNMRWLTNFPFLKLVKVLKNSTQGEITYIQQIKLVQIGAIKLERTQIHF